MANTIPEVSQTPSSNTHFETKKCHLDLGFAIALIIALGAILTGVLGIYKVSFFAKMGAEVSLGLAASGAIFLTGTLVSYVVALCLAQRTEKPVSQPDPEPPLQTPPPQEPVIVPDPEPAPEQEPTPLEPTPESQPEPEAIPATDQKPKVQEPEPAPPQPISVVIPSPTPAPRPAPVPIKTLSPWQINVKSPYPWQPLVKLQETRAGSTDSIPPKLCPILEYLKTHEVLLATNYQVVGMGVGPRTKPSKLINALKKVYREILQGECQIPEPKRNEPSIVKRTTPPPRDIIEQARAFVCARIEAYNVLRGNRPKIESQNFFEGFEQEEQQLFNQTKEIFSNRLIADITALFQGKDASGLQKGHLTDIQGYIYTEVAQFNEHNVEKIDPEAILHKLNNLAVQIKLWALINQLIAHCSHYDIDSKISLLQTFCDRLPTPYSPIWDDFPLFRHLFTNKFLDLNAPYKDSSKFSIGHRFLPHIPEDRRRKDKIEKTMHAIAERLCIQAPEVLLYMDTSQDGQLAQADQDAWHAQEQARLEQASLELALRLQREG